MSSILGLVTSRWCLTIKRVKVIVPNADGTLKYVGVAPAVVPLLSLWPVQNGPELGGGIAYAYSHPLQTIREDFGTTRLDYNLSSKDSLFGAYTIDDSAANTPSVNPLSLVAVDVFASKCSAFRNNTSSRQPS